MAASLLLEDPERYFGLVMFAGCFAVSDVALPASRLSGKPVLFCRGKYDHVIPAHKFEQAERYLAGASGARATLLAYKGGHELPIAMGSSVRAWLRAEEG
jgi:phospholipase/carboxylesterase